MGYPEKFETHVNAISHDIKKIYIEGDYLIADIQILNVRAGEELKESIDLIVFRPRSAGIVLENNEVKLRELFTFDAIEKDIDSFKNLM